MVSLFIVKNFTARCHNSCRGNKEQYGTLNPLLPSRVSFDGTHRTIKKILASDPAYLKTFKKMKRLVLYDYLKILFQLDVDNEWVTAPKINQYPDFFNRNHRTSTPKRGVPFFNEKEESMIKESKNSYVSWKKHLAEPKNVFKIRGLRVSCPDFISGHLTTKLTTKDEMPIINTNFINLILNQPSPEELISTKDANKLCKHEWSPICCQLCECNRIPNRNVDLPIGYKIDDDGFISQSRPTLYKQILYKE